MHPKMKANWGKGRKALGYTLVALELPPVMIEMVNHLAKLRDVKKVVIYREALQDHLNRVSACFPKSKRR